MFWEYQIVNLDDNSMASELEAYVGRILLFAYFISYLAIFKTESHFTIAA